MNQGDGGRGEVLLDGIKNQEIVGGHPALDTQTKPAAHQDIQCGESFSAKDKMEPGEIQESRIKICFPDGELIYPVFETGDTTIDLHQLVRGVLTDRNTSFLLVQENLHGYHKIPIDEVQDLFETWNFTENTIVKVFWQGVSGRLRKKWLNQATEYENEVINRRLNVGSDAFKAETTKQTLAWERGYRNHPKHNEEKSELRSHRKRGSHDPVNGPAPRSVHIKSSVPAKRTRTEDTAESANTKRSRMDAAAYQEQVMTQLYRWGREFGEQVPSCCKIYNDVGKSRIVITSKSGEILVNEPLTHGLFYNQNRLWVWAEERVHKRVNRHQQGMIWKLKVHEHRDEDLAKDLFHAIMKHRR